MKGEKDQLKWDYFLNNYERDLLRLPFDEAVQKYPLVESDQIKAYWVAIRIADKIFSKPLV